MQAVARAANRRLMSQARQEVRVHSRWEIVGPAEKQRQAVGTILTVMYVIMYVGGDPFLARELLSDRRMPRPDQATKRSKKQPKRNGEKTKLKKSPGRTYDPRAEWPLGNRANVSRTLGENNGKASYNPARFCRIGSLV